MFVVLTGLVALIVGGFTLSRAAKLLRFHNPPLSTSFSSMAIAVRVPVVGVLAMPRILSSWVGAGAVVAFGAVVGVISVAFLFRESMWKAVPQPGLYWQARFCASECASK